MWWRYHRSWHLYLFRRAMYSLLFVLEVVFLISIVYFIYKIKTGQ